MNFRVVISGLVLLTSATLTSFAQKKNSNAKTTAKTEQVADVIQWISVEEMEEKMKKEPRMVLFDFYTDWCGWCKVMDKKTFANKELAQYVNKHYYAVKFNAESRKPVTFRGKTYEFKPEYKANMFAAEFMNGQMSYPTVVIAGENISFLNPLPGYQRLDMMESVLKYFVSVKAPSQESWNEHNRNFKASWAPGPESK